MATRKTITGLERSREIALCLRILATLTAGELQTVQLSARHPELGINALRLAERAASLSAAVIEGLQP